MQFSKRKAVQQLSSGKAPGADAIPADVYKVGGLPMAEKLTDLFHCMWRKEAIPQEFKDAPIIHLYKRKDIHKSVTATGHLPPMHCWEDTGNRQFRARIGLVSHLNSPTHMNLLKK